MNYFLSTILVVFGLVLLPLSVSEAGEPKVTGGPIDLDVLVAPMRKLADRLLEQVNVQAAAEAAIGRDDDVTYPIHRSFDRERMTILGVGRSEVPNDPTNTLGVWARLGHLLLRLANFRRCNHLHRAGDLLHVLDASDL